VNTLTKQNQTHIGQIIKTKNLLMNKICWNCNYFWGYDFVGGRTYSCHDTHIVEKAKALKEVDHNDSCERWISNLR
jgi:hypothetical protein